MDESTADTAPPQEKVPLTISAAGANTSDEGKAEEAPTIDSKNTDLLDKIKQVDEILLLAESSHMTTKISMVQEILKRNVELMDIISKYQKCLETLDEDGMQVDGESSDSLDPTSPEFVDTYVNSIQELNSNLNQVVRLYQETEC